MSLLFCEADWVKMLIFTVEPLTTGWTVAWGSPAVDETPCVVTVLPGELLLLGFAAAIGATVSTGNSCIGFG